MRPATRATACARRFDKAVDYGLEAADLVAYQLVCLHAAMRLAGRVDQIGRIEERLRRNIKPNLSAPHVRYVLGEITQKQLKRQSRSELYRGWAFWLTGIDAELRKDTAGAIKAYRVAANTKRNTAAKRLAARWLKTLEGQPAVRPGR